MGYNAENCKKIAEIYSNKNFNAQKEAEARREKLHMLFPDVFKIVLSTLIVVYAFSARNVSSPKIPTMWNFGVYRKSTRLNSSHVF